MKGNTKMREANDRKKSAVLIKANKRLNRSGINNIAC